MIGAAWHGSRPVLTLVAGLALLWQALYLGVGDAALASPWTTLTFTAQLVASDMFWGHAGETLKAFAAALAIAVSVGLTLGLWLGAHRLAGEVVTPVLAAVASIPKITLYPIVLLLFGLGMPSKIAFGAFHGVTPIALITIGAVSGIKPVLLKLARLQQLDALSLARRILLPAALPEIFTGLRIGFSLTLIGTILGEMFAAQKGIGYLLMNAIGLHNVRLIMALTLLLTTFAATFGGLLLSIDRRIRSRYQAT
jgi:NitT/TauT family transport system permease protein